MQVEASSTCSSRPYILFPRCHSFRTLNEQQDNRLAEGVLVACEVESDARNLSKVKNYNGATRCTPSVPRGRGKRKKD